MAILAGLACALGLLLAEALSPNHAGALLQIKPGVNGADAAGVLDANGSMELRLLGSGMGRSGSGGGQTCNSGFWPKMGPLLTDFKCIEVVAQGIGVNFRVQPKIQFKKWDIAFPSTKRSYIVKVFDSPVAKHLPMCIEDESDKTSGEVAAQMREEARAMCANAQRMHEGGAKAGGKYITKCLVAKVPEAFDETVPYDFLLMEDARAKPYHTTNGQPVDWDRMDWKTFAVEQGKPDEIAEAFRVSMTESLEALKFLKSKQWLHYDIKTENMILTIWRDKTQNIIIPVLKLIDLGSAMKVGENQGMDPDTNYNSPPKETLEFDSNKKMHYDTEYPFSWDLYMLSGPLVELLVGAPWDTVVPQALQYYKSEKKHIAPIAHTYKKAGDTLNNLLTEYKKEGDWTNAGYKAMMFIRCEFTKFACGGDEDPTIFPQGELEAIVELWADAHAEDNHMRSVYEKVWKQLKERDRELYSRVLLVLQHILAYMPKERLDPDTLLWMFTNSN